MSFLKMRPLTNSRHKEEEVRKLFYDELLKDKPIPTQPFQAIFSK